MRRRNEDIKRSDYQSVDEERGDGCFPFLEGPRREGGSGACHAEEGRM